MKTAARKPDDELRPEYVLDYSKAVRGKYRQQLLEDGSNIVSLDPDVAKVFKDSNAVNETLRALLEITRSTQRLAKRRSKS